MIKRLLRRVANVVVPGRSGAGSPGGGSGQIGETDTWKKGVDFDDKNYNTFYNQGESAILDNPFLAAKIYPMGGEGIHFREPRKDAGTGEFEGRPVPPQTLREGYGREAAGFMESGRIYAEKLSEKFNAHAQTQSLENRRVLDWGCACARVLQYVPDYCDAKEYWGVDISASHVAWCQSNLGDHFFVSQCTTFPHLPFEDGHFDFIYGMSVFTHISDLADMWLLELRRVLKPGGIVAVTVHDDDSLEHIMKQEEGGPESWLKEITLRLENADPFLEERDYNCFSVGTRSPAGTQMFYRTEHLKKRWGQFFTLVDRTNGEFHPGDFQSLWVLRKDGS